MFKILLTLLQALIILPLCSVEVEYAIKATRKKNNFISKFVILSERCSGSNYLFKLVKSNFLISAPIFCHKHFPPWYDLPKEKWLGNPVHYTFEGTEDTLFFVIFRNPYDWVRSLHQQPFESAAKLRNITFYDFIRTTWALDPKLPIVKHEMEVNPLVDLNPDTGKPFKNVLKLRTAKAKNMYQVSKLANNTYLINYETVRDYPQEVLAEIQKIFDLIPTQVYHPVDSYKGFKELGQYAPKEYERISQFDLFYINSQLDEKFERKIGYKLTSDAGKIK